VRQTQRGPTARLNAVSDHRRHESGMPTSMWFPWTPFHGRDIVALHVRCSRAEPMYEWRVIRDGARFHVSPKKTFWPGNSTSKRLADRRSVSHSIAMWRTFQRGVACFPVPGSAVLPTLKAPAYSKYHDLNWAYVE
jgi:hypothetical protein